MRLLNYEGEVFLVDDNGEYSFLMENMRFNNGESLSTSKGSMASVGFDSSKILTLDAMTQVLFETVKNQMDKQSVPKETPAANSAAGNVSCTIGIHRDSRDRNKPDNRPDFKIMLFLRYIKRQISGQ